VLKALATDPHETTGAIDLLIRPCRYLHASLRIEEEACLRKDLVEFGAPAFVALKPPIQVFDSGQEIAFATVA
jgi:hypothetical protein